MEVCALVGKKRQWQLRDKEDDLQDLSDTNKRLKGIQSSMDENMIEVVETSLKWPQDDQ